MEGVVQFALLLFRQVGRVDRTLWKKMEQGRAAAPLVRGLRVECGQPAVDRAAFGRELGEPPLQRGTPFAVEVVVAGRLVGLS